MPAWQTAGVDAPGYNFAWIASSGGRGAVDAEAAEEGREDDLGIHHREVLADALARAGAEVIGER